MLMLNQLNEFILSLSGRSCAYNIYLGASEALRRRRRRALYTHINLPIGCAALALTQPNRTPLPGENRSHPNPPSCPPPSPFRLPVLLAPATPAKNCVCVCAPRDDGNGCTLCEEGYSLARVQTWLCLRVSALCVCTPPSPCAQQLFSFTHLSYVEMA